MADCISLVHRSSPIHMVQLFITAAGGEKMRQLQVVAKIDSGTPSCLAHHDLVKEVRTIKFVLNSA